jgi:hypothetical protein
MHFLVLDIGRSYQSATAFAFLTSLAIFANKPTLPLGERAERVVKKDLIGKKEAQ